MEMENVVLVLFIRVDIYVIITDYYSWYLRYYYRLLELISTLLLQTIRVDIYVIITDY